MNERRQIRLGLIGFGEVGSTLGRGLRAEGLRDIASFDKYAFDGPFAELVQRRAAEAQIPLVRSPRELAERSDVLLGVTPGSASIESAQAFAPHLAAGHVFADLASATPRVKRAVGEHLIASGARIADASIMGTPHVDGYRLPILASGPAAQIVRDLMNPWGLEIECVPGELGAASGIKIMRSVVAKGLEALLVECMLGSRRLGIDEAVLASFAKFMDSRPFTEIANFLLVTDAIHSGRRAEEANMSAEALEEAGVEPIMTRATAQRLRWVTGLDLKGHFAGVVPRHYAEAVEAMELVLGGSGRSTRT